MDEKKSKATHATTAVATSERPLAQAATPFHVEQPASGAAGAGRRRPAPLSYGEVAQAAEAIDAAGEKVTIARIRQQVGGAAETVTAFLGQWREARRTARTSGHDGLPDSLRVALLREFGLQREAAQAEMQEQFAEQREAASELDIELRRARDTIAAQEQSAAALRDELLQAKEQVAAGEHAVALVRQRCVAEVETLTRQHHGLEEKLAQALHDLGQMRCRAEVEAGRAKTLAAENDRLRAEATQAVLKAEDAAQKVAAAEQKAAVATTKLEGQAELLAIAREQSQQYRRRISELLAEAKDSHDRAHAAEETQKQLRHKLDAAHAGAHAATAVGKGK